MTNFNSGLAAKLAKLNAEPKKGGGNGKFAPRQKKIFSPGIETKYIKDGFFSWQTVNSKGNPVNTDTPGLKGIIVGQYFNWRDLSETEKGKKDWAVRCATTSHTDEDADGNPVQGNGRWDMPFFDHAEILERYKPMGMKLREPYENEVDAAGNPVTEKQILSCEDCIASGLRTCKDDGKIFFVPFKKIDKETEEWVDCKPVLMGLRTSRGDYDYLRKYEMKLAIDHQKMPHEVVTELGFTGKDKYDNHKLTYTPDVDEDGWAAIAIELYEAEKAEFEAALEVYKAEKAAEREANKGAGDAADPAAKVTTTVKPVPGAAAAKTNVVDISSKGAGKVTTVAKTAQAPKPVATVTTPDPEPVDGEEVPF